MAGGERAGCPLAMDADLLLLAGSYVVILELGDVVGHIIHQVHSELFPRLTERFRENLARLVGQKLAVAPGEIGCGAHGSQVRLTLGTTHRRAGKLRVGQVETIPLWG